MTSNPYWKPYDIKLYRHQFRMKFVADGPSQNFEIRENPFLLLAVLSPQPLPAGTFDLCSAARGIHFLQFRTEELGRLRVQHVDVPIMFARFDTMRVQLRFNGGLSNVANLKTDDEVVMRGVLAVETDEDVPLLGDIYDPDLPWWEGERGEL